MYTNSILAATAALLSVVAAVPMADQHRHHHLHNKREYVWATHTEVVIKTIPVTKTVWVDASETPPPSEKTPDVKPPKVDDTPKDSPAPAYTPPSSPEEPANDVAPSSSSSTSVYVAPTPPSVYTPPPPPPPPPAPTTPSTTAAPPTYVAPTPSPDPAPPSPDPAPPSPDPAPPSSDPAPPSDSTGSGLSSGMGKSGTSYTGDLTWYEVGLGACGKSHSPSDAVVAISHAIFDSYSTGNPNTNPLCGKMVSITGANGQSYEAEIVDRCPGCTPGSLDLAHDLFNEVTAYGDGRVGDMSWKFD